MSSLALVVENDSSTRKLLDVVLTRFGYEVDAVANGSDALVLLASIDYALTVLDLFVPGASGDQILGWLEQHRPAAVARTVVLSSAPMKHLQAVREGHPGARVIRKPFELQELIDLATAIGRDRPQSASAPTDRFARRSVVAGAKAGLIVRKRGAEISLVHKFGYPADVAERWFPMSANSTFPLCQSVREGRPQWLACLTVAAREFPELETVWQANQSRALATVPLIRDGVVLGAAGWTFREPQAFNEYEQRAFTDIAEDAAAALEAM